MKLPKIKCFVGVKFVVNEWEVGKKGGGGGGREKKFSLRIVCQNHIPFSIKISGFDLLFPVLLKHREYFN